MKRITLLIALVLSITLVSLIKSDSTVNAQPPDRFKADTGVVTLGLNQKLRVVVTGMGGNDATTVRFGRMEYTQDACGSGVCKLVVASQSMSAPVTLVPDEAASMDITPVPGSSGVRAVVVNNRRNVRATAAIIDTITGELTFLETMEDDECGL
jgi:hypothetical protein